MLPLAPGNYKQPETQVLGSQTAVVTRPGRRKEIHCDQYGRIKVQFPLDREGQATTRLLLAESLLHWPQHSTAGIANPPRIGRNVLITPRRRPDQRWSTGACTVYKDHPVP